MNDYKTISKIGNSLLIEKKSKFIGAAFPVSTEKEALEKIELKRKEYFDARHNVYAFRIRENNAEKYSDDGEPQKTAGVPILDILKKEDITDICIVVTRYFGGTLLGTGGLVRAYSQAAAEAITDAEVCSMILYSVFNASLDYSCYDRICLIVKSLSGYTDNMLFSENVSLEISALPEKVEEIKKAITEITAGKCELSNVLTQTFKIKCRM